MARGKLFVNIRSAEISVAREGPPPEGCVEVPKVTATEHLRIAQDYLPQLDALDQPRFRAILTLGDFWHRWSREIKVWGYGKYAKPWVDFRFSRLCGLFQERVRSLGAADWVVAASLENLKRLKTKAFGITVTSDRVSTASSMRRAVLHSISTMSDEDLRQVWLPVGAMCDALRKG
jgi:hypothetical protein